MPSGWLEVLMRRRAAGDEEVVVHMLVARAQSRLDAQQRDVQGLDLKALGLLGADAAAVGVLIAVQPPSIGSGGSTPLASQSPHCRFW